MKNHEQTVIHGDCTSVLRMFDDCRFDAIVTDPPAGIGFMGKEWDHHKGGRDSWIAWMQTIAAECLRVVKPGGHALVWAIPRTSHWTATAWENGGWEVRDRLAFLFATGFPKSLNLPGGLGTALKPACEDWWLLRKPLVGTVSANVQTFGTGALRIDECRIGYLSETDKESAKPASWPNANESIGTFQTKDRSHYNPDEKQSTIGRWPANLLHDGSPEVVGMFPESDGQAAEVGPEHGPKPSVNAFGDFGPRDTFAPRGDSGSAARFFFSGKATRADREEGLADFDAKQQDDGREADAPGANNPRNRGGQARRNNHPTVKPTALMRWLCRLITPADGTVLDPFAGSGSTGKACAFERLGFVGIEQNSGYVAIARARIAWAMAHAEPIQLSLLEQEI